MTGWRKKCDEIEAAAAKATDRPWVWEADDASMVTLGTAGDVERGHVLSCTRCRACQESGNLCLLPEPRDAAFIKLAANNADRLARFTTELSKEAQLLWAKLHGVKIGMGGIPAFNEMVDRLWEESAK